MFTKKTVQVELSSGHKKQMTSENANMGYVDNLIMSPLFLLTYRSSGRE